MHTQFVSDLRVFVCVAVIAFTLPSADGGESASSETMQQGEVGTFDWKPPFRQKNDCGRASLYIMARLLGKPVAYEKIEAVLPLDPEKGTSLAELSLAATKLGIANRAKFVTPEQFSSLRFPVILHGNSSLKSPIGHFLIVTARAKDGESCGTIDTERNSYSTYPLKTILYGFSGYVLEPAEDNQLWDSGYLLLGTAILLGTLSYRLRRVSCSNNLP